MRRNVLRSFFHTKITAEVAAMDTTPQEGELRSQEQVLIQEREARRLRQLERKAVRLQQVQERQAIKIQRQLEREEQRRKLYEERDTQR